MSNVEEARSRRKKKLRLTRARQNLILATLVLFAAGLAVGGFYLINSDLWLLKTITVTGNKHIAADKVSALAGLDENTNLMRISKEDIEARIKRDPWIAEASVTRDLPSSLNVSIIERKPFARVKQRGKLYTLDRRGYVIEAVSDATSDTIPVINEIRTGRLEVGRRAKTKLLRNALKSLASISTELRDRVIWISVPSLDKLAFHTADDVEIIFGSADEARKKNLVIKEILTEFSKEVVHINVSVPDNPVVRKLQI